MHVTESSIINDFRDVPCGYEGRLKDAAPIPLRPVFYPHPFVPFKVSFENERFEDGRTVDLGNSR